MGILLWSLKYISTIWKNPGRLDSTLICVCLILRKTIQYVPDYEIVDILASYTKMINDVKNIRHFIICRILDSTIDFCLFRSFASENFRFNHAYDRPLRGTLYLASGQPEVWGLLMSWGWDQNVQISTDSMGWVNEGRLKLLNSVQGWMSCY